MLRVAAMVGAILAGHAAAAQQIDLPRRPGVALGLAANNPLNLSTSRAAIGYALDRDGNHVAVYSSLSSGIGASLSQLAGYQRQGLTTPRQMVTRWVCGQRCTAEQEAALPGYIRDVAVAVGTSPDAPIDFTDPATAAAFILAAQPHETGSPHFSAAADTHRVTGPAVAVAAPPRQQSLGAQVLHSGRNTQIAFGR